MLLPARQFWTSSKSEPYETSRAYWRSCKGGHRPCTSIPNEEENETEVSTQNVRKETEDKAKNCPRTLGGSYDYIKRSKKGNASMF
mgnify:CR=1 FL=1